MQLSSGFKLERGTTSVDLPPLFRNRVTRRSKIYHLKINLDPRWNSNHLIILVMLRGVMLAVFLADSQSKCDFL